MAVLDKPVAVRSRVDFAVTLPTTLRTATPCRLADVHFVPNAGPAAGSIFGALQIHNASRTPCALSGGPILSLVTSRGVIFASTKRTPPTVAAPTVILVPDSWATTRPWPLGGSCGGQGKTATLRIGLPSDPSRLSFPFPNGSDVMPARCSGTGKALRARPHPGQMDTPNFLPIDHVDNYATWNLGSVTASLRVPPTVRAGQDLDYVVVLAFPGDPTQAGGVDDVGFVGDGAAPLYQQSMDGQGRPESYELNWGPVVELKPYEGVAYRMRLHVSAETPAGPTTLTWQFVEPAMPALTATVTVVAR